jgi:hypothetical protein
MRPSAAGSAPELRARLKIARFFSVHRLSMGVVAGGVTTRVDGAVKDTLDFKEY